MSMINCYRMFLLIGLFWVTSPYLFASDAPPMPILPGDELEEGEEGDGEGESIPNESVSVQAPLEDTDWSEQFVIAF